MPFALGLIGWGFMRWGFFLYSWMVFGWLVLWFGRRSKKVVHQKHRDLRKQMIGQEESVGQKMNGTQNGVDRVELSRNQL